MFFNFTSNFMETLDLTVEIWIGNQSQGKQRMQLPFMLVSQQCNKLINQIAGYDAPAKIKISSPHYLENGQIAEQYSIYANNKWLNEFGEEAIWSV